MNKKKSVKPKGMTLVEVVVAMGVVIVVAAMLVCAVESAIINIRNANKVSSKNAAQAPYAANQLEGTKDGDISLEFKCGGAPFTGMQLEQYHVTHQPDKLNPSESDKVGDYRYFNFVTETTVTTATS